MQLTQFQYENDFDNLVKKGMTLDKQVLGFLNFLKKKQFNGMIELYKKDNNTWKKQELSPDNKNVNETNC